MYSASFTILQCIINNNNNCTEVMIRLSPFFITYGHFGELTSGGKVNLEVCICICVLAHNPEI